MGEGKAFTPFFLQGSTSLPQPRPPQGGLFKIRHGVKRAPMSVRNQDGKVGRTIRGQLALSLPLWGRWAGGLRAGPRPGQGPGWGEQIQAPGAPVRPWGGLAQSARCPPLFGGQARWRPGLLIPFTRCSYSPLKPWVRCPGISGGFLDTFLTPKKYRPPAFEWGIEAFGVGNGWRQRRVRFHLIRLGLRPIHLPLKGKALGGPRLAGAQGRLLPRPLFSCPVH